MLTSRRSDTASDPSCRPVDLHGVALPFMDGLVVLSSNGGVIALDPAGRRLWEALQAGCAVNDLVVASVEHAGLPMETARTHVWNALESWRALGLVDASGQAAVPTQAAPSLVVRPNDRAPALDALYLVGDRPVRVRCDDVLLGEVIDAACKACRVVGAAQSTPVVDVIAQHDDLAVRADEAFLAKNHSPTRNGALARHRCLTALLEMARHRRRWLGILHASAVGISGRCIVFPGAKGAGKSTLAAALVAAGADFVTDDYAPLERGTCHVWPVPYAPGIKSGSWPALRLRYSDLDATPVYELAGQQIRYLELDAARMAPLDRNMPIGALLFPRYRTGAVFEQRRMTAAEALAELFAARSMLDLRPNFLQETLRWVESVPAYEMIYGDLDPAIDWILSLR